MSNQSTRRLRELDLVELPHHVPDRDWHEFCYSYQLWQCMWEDICPHNRLVAGEIRRIFNVIKDDKSFMRHLNTSLINVYGNIINGRLFPFTGDKFTKAICRCITEVMRTYNCNEVVEVLNHIASLLTWFKRLPILLPSPNEEWLEYSNRVSRTIERPSREILLSIREIAKEWFGDFVLPDHFLCSHGSGSTSDAGKVLDHKIWLNTIPQWRASLLRTYDGEPLFTGGNVYDVPSQFQSVPKQFGKNRFICCEPSYLQFAQHNVFGHLREFIEDRSHPMFRYLALRDQTRNRDLCSQAFSCKLATIDLSNASDDVHYSTWKEIFLGLPLWRYIVGCRSKVLSFQDQECSPNYVAPMGSAVCFIFESICFALVLEHVFRSVHQRKCRGYLDKVSVYGDDLICPVDMAEQVIDVLRQLGFTVNSSKTFLDTEYHESCGVEYWRDWQISRINHPRALLSPVNVTLARLNLVCDLARTLEEGGFSVTRRHLMSTWCTKRVFPLGKRVSQCIDWKDNSVDQEYIVPKTFDPSLQCYVYTSPVVVTRSEDRDTAYEAWLYDHLPRPRQSRLERSLGYHRLPVPVPEAIERLVPFPSRRGTGLSLIHI